MKCIIKTGAILFLVILCSCKEENKKAHKQDTREEKDITLIEMVQDVHEKKLLVPHFIYQTDPEVLQTATLSPQNLVQDSTGKWHLVFLTKATHEDHIRYTFSLDGEVWNIEKIITTLSRLDKPSARYMIYMVKMVVDIVNHLHILYRYDGDPLYYQGGYADYPPAHFAYITDESGSFSEVTEVIEPYDIQVTEGNKNTVTYVNDFGFWIDYFYTLHFTGLDYSWFATKYHLLYSYKLEKKDWSAISAPETVDLGSIDLYPLRGLSFGGPKNGTYAYAIWLDRSAGKVYGMKFEGVTAGQKETVLDLKTPISAKDEAGSRFIASHTFVGDTLYGVFLIQEKALQVEKFLIITRMSGKWETTEITGVSPKDIGVLVVGSAVQIPYLFFTTKVTGKRDTIMAVNLSNLEGNTPEKIYEAPENTQLLDLTVDPYRSELLVFSERTSDGRVTLQSMWFK